MDITMILAFGGTRTAFILENNLNKENVGEIDYKAYTEYALGRIQSIIQHYFNAGGHNLIIEVLDIHLLTSKRGSDYVEQSTRHVFDLAGEDYINFYTQMDLEVRFIGIDVLCNLPVKHPAHRLGNFLHEFNETQTYTKDKRKIIWNIASIHLHTLHEISRHSDLQIDTSNLLNTASIYYNYFSEKVYGLELPRPQAFIGSNRNGRMALSTALPIAVGVEHGLRLFYVPFPTFFMTETHFKIMINDLEPDQSEDTQLDYRNLIERETALIAYEEFVEAARKNRIHGLHSKRF